MTKCPGGASPGDAQSARRPSPCSDSKFASLFLPPEKRRSNYSAKSWIGEKQVLHYARRAPADKLQKCNNNINTFFGMLDCVGTL